LSQITNKGFKKALHVPLALALKIASNRNTPWIIMGSFAKNKGDLQFSVQLYNVKTGEMVKEITATHKNILNALDIISDEIGQLILTKIKVKQSNIPQLAISEHTSNNMNAIHDVILALNAVTFENDYKTSNHYLEEAIKKDPSFAMVHVYFLRNYQSLGDIGNMIVHTKKALALDYKLYQETVFIMKASLFALQGKQDKSTKILENLVKIYPKSIDALSILANNYIMIGHRQKDAEKMYKKLYEAEGASSKALINLSKIERLRNNKDKAIAYLKKYIEANPAKAKAYIELADTYKQFGLFAKSKEMYEEASLYDDKDFQAEIGIASVTAAVGDYNKAVEQLESLLKSANNDRQKVAILSKIIEINTYTGQISKNLELLPQISKHAKKVMQPLAFAFQIDGSKIYLFAMIGQYDKAQKAVEKLKKELKYPFSMLIGAISKSMYEAQKDMESYKKALVQEKEFVEKYNLATLMPDVLMAEAYIKSFEKDYKAAEKLYQQAIDETQQSFVTLITTNQIDEIIYHYAQTLIILEKYTQAIDMLDIVLTRSPIFAKVHFLKAKIYKKMGDEDKMREEIAITDKIWQDADKNYLDYQAFIKFKAELNK
ncbi:MAG TPA: hypothetical protein ENJ44_02420, partial [Oceanospirillales bacterium]|nr:hypothetical protein [Oceanospirillales bacterium]